jgi:hypothetical protein
MIKKLLFAFCMIPFGAMAQPSMPDDASLLALHTESSVELKDDKSRSIETRLEMGRMDAEFVLFVNSPETTTMLVQLMDQNGKALPLVRHVVLEEGDNEVRLDLSIYPAGAYMIALQAPNQRSSVIHRLYKQN